MGMIKDEVESIYHLTNEASSLTINFIVLLFGAPGSNGYPTNQNQPIVAGLIIDCAGWAFESYAGLPPSKLSSYGIAFN
jgi:hypothetical protein